MLYLSVTYKGREGGWIGRGDGRGREVGVSREEIGKCKVTK